MKKQIILYMLLLLTGTTQGQSTINRVLRQVEANNKALQASLCNYDVQLLESKSKNNLPDPSVTYSHQYANRAGMDMQGEFVASQSFEFPTVYSQRKKLTVVRRQLFSSQYMEERQQVLFNAKNICLDLVWLNQRRQVLQERRRHAQQLAALYDKRMRAGDANILETNKIKLELLNVKTEERLNETMRNGKMQELATLNGGHAVTFADTVYPSSVEHLSWESLRDEALTYDATLQALQYRQAEARRLIDVSRAEGLPELEMGYRLNLTSGGERYNGFLIGVSIPLFSNRHQVKKAKNQSLSIDLQCEQATVETENRLKRLYNRLQILHASIDEYRHMLDSQDNFSLLNKALLSGQISMIEYFVSMATFYQSMDNQMQLQNEYQKVMAEIYRYKL